MNTTKLPLTEFPLAGLRPTGRGVLLLLGASLLGSSAIAGPNSGSGETLNIAERTLAAVPVAPAGALDTFHEALTNGKFFGSMRSRFESVDQTQIGAPFDSEARASTLRTRLGYETGKFHGMSGVLEFSNVATVPGGYSDYTDGVNSMPNRPVILDPKGTVVNQVYMQYDDVLGGKMKLGRQRINLGNQRFIGNHGFRQTEQTFDSVSYDGNYKYGLSMYYAYIDRVNNILGTSQEHGSHVINVAKNWENLGTLTAYGYYLDFPDGDMAVASSGSKSTVTIGGNFVGNMNLGDNRSLLYGVELAHQSDVGDNPVEVSAMYSHAYLGGEVSGISAKVGFESLDGHRSGDSDRAFQTPLGSMHQFNGWADKFLATPAGGLEDVYLRAGYRRDAFGAAITFHNFDAELSAVGSYGSELDAQITYDVNENMVVGLKMADFNADNDNTIGLEDTKKYWIWASYSW